jgi:hypothetical protein
MECCAKDNNELVRLVWTMDRDSVVPACGLEFSDAVASSGLSTTGRDTKRGIRRGKTEEGQWGR